MKYHRLTREHRYQIQSLKDSGLGIREIARVLKRSPSTISRELLYLKDEPYLAEQSHQQYLDRRKYACRKKKIVEDLKVKVDELLNIQWSPVQISERLKMESIRLSHETIYKYIFQNSQEQGSLYLNLRRKRKARRSKLSMRNFKNCGVRVNQYWIEERPAIVESRSRIGDFERDSVLGKNGRLLTIVDRTSRLTKIAKQHRHSSCDTHYDTIRLLKNEIVHTITNDNGPEFGLHSQTAKELNAEVYFTRPYCSWQRGTNENTNGLIRQYYPKGHDFSNVSSEDIKRVENLLNNRPRKCLGFKTPNEVHNQLSQVLR